MHQAADVTVSEQSAEHGIAGLAVLFADHLWDMVGAHWPVEADLAQCPHGCRHVGRSVVMKGFCKCLGSSANVSEMHVLYFFPKAADRRWDIAAHCRKRPLTKTDRAIGRVVPSHQLVKTLDAVHDSRFTEQTSERRVIRMHRHRYSTRFSNR